MKSLINLKVLCFLLLGLPFLWVSTNCQDIISLRNGKEIKGLVVEVNKNQVFYRSIINKDSYRREVSSLKKSKVSSISINGMEKIDITNEFQYLNKNVGVWDTLFTIRRDTFLCLVENNDPNLESFYYHPPFSETTLEILNGLIQSCYLQGTGKMVRIPGNEKLLLLRSSGPLKLYEEIKKANDIIPLDKKGLKFTLSPYNHMFLANNDTLAEIFDDELFYETLAKFMNDAPETFQKIKEKNITFSQLQEIVDFYNEEKRKNQ